MLQTRRTLLLALAVLGAAAACSASETNFQEAAEKVIKEDITTQAGFGELTSSCEEPASTDVGETFACTAKTSDGQTIELIATISDKTKVDVNTTNLITADGVTTIEGIAVGALEEETGLTLGAENLDCGDGALITTVTDIVIDCVLTDPTSGEEPTPIPAVNSLGNKNCSGCCRIARSISNTNSGCCCRKCGICTMCEQYCGHSCNRPLNCSSAINPNRNHTFR